MTVKAAFDFGKTIALIEEDRPFPNSFETIRMIVGKLAPDNVFIISKAKRETSTLILAWLQRHHFFTATHFLPKNVYFVEEYQDKRVLVDKLGINFFVDDSVKIVRALYSSPHIRKIVWFRGNRVHLREIPRKYRQKIVISNDWGRLYKVFTKPCSGVAVGQRVMSIRNNES